MATPLTYDPLFTQDADIAFANRADLKGDIRSTLAQAGFAEEFFGEDDPPVTHYTLGEAEGAFYAEFLTPLIGSGTKRSGKPDSAISSAGITAQKLRYLEVLLIAPWPVSIEAENGFDVPEKTVVRVANPVTFIAQKLLIQNLRKPDKRAQDLLYIHDTLELFAAQLPALGEQWRGNILPELSGDEARRIGECVDQAFRSITDTIRDAARIPPTRVLSPDRLRQYCEAALVEIFG